MADCRICKHNYKPSNCEPKCNRMCDGASDFEPITNVDKIRSMSDEQLAEFFANFNNTFGEEHEGKMSFLDWLQSEVEE